MYPVKSWEKEYSFYLVLQNNSVGEHFKEGEEADSTTWDSRGKTFVPSKDLQMEAYNKGSVFQVIWSFIRQKNKTKNTALGAYYSSSKL